MVFLIDFIIYFNISSVTCFSHFFLAFILGFYGCFFPLSAFKAQIEMQPGADDADPLFICELLCGGNRPEVQLSRW